MTESPAIAKPNPVSPAARQPSAAAAVDSALSPRQSREILPQSEKFVPFQSHHVKLDQSHHAKLEGADTPVASQAAGSESWGQKGPTRGGGEEQQAAGFDLTCTEELDFSDVQARPALQSTTSRLSTPYRGARFHPP